MYVSYNLLLLRIRGNSLLLGKEFLELAPEHQQKEYEIAHIHDASKNCHIGVVFVGAVFEIVDDRPRTNCHLQDL